MPTCVYKCALRRDDLELESLRQVEVSGQQLDEERVESVAGEEVALF